MQPMHSKIKLALIGIATLTSILMMLLSGLGVATHHMLACSPADGLCKAAVDAWQGKEGWLVLSFAMAACAAWLLVREVKLQNATCKSDKI